MLEKLAARTLEKIDPKKIKKQKFPKPLFIELSGTFNSGKSAIKECLYTFFRRTGFNVHVLPEPAGTIEIDKSDWFFYNIRAGAYTIDNLLDRVGEKKYHIIIFERSIFDILSWWRFLYEKGDINWQTMRLNQNFFSQEQQRQKSGQ